MSDVRSGNSGIGVVPRIGSRWVWEIDTDARCLLEVTEVTWNGEEWWVTTKALLPDSYHLYRALSRGTLEVGGRPGMVKLIGEPDAYNTLSRFWEAVTPVGGTVNELTEMKPVPEVSHG